VAPILDRDALEECLRLVAGEATRHLAEVDAAPVRPPASGDGLGARCRMKGQGRSRRSAR
jgi:hypothetical protein